MRLRFLVLFLHSHKQKIGLVEEIAVIGIFLEQFLGGQGLQHFFKGESFLGQGVEDLGEGAVIDLQIVHKPRGDPFPRNTVIGKIDVELLAFLVLRPTASRGMTGHQRMLLGKEEHAAAFQQTMHVFCHGSKILDVMKRQGADHKIKAIVDLVKTLHGEAAVLDAGIGVLAVCHLQHLLGDVNAQNTVGAACYEHLAMLAVAAAKVEDALALKIGEQGKEGGDLKQIVGVALLLTELSVALKKDLVVVDVLL